MDGPLIGTEQCFLFEKKSRPENEHRNFIGYTLEHIEYATPHYIYSFPNYIISKICHNVEQYRSKFLFKKKKTILLSSQVVEK